MKRRYRKFALILLLAAAPAALAADRERVKEIGEELICVCMCNQLLTGCNHINCPSSGGMLKELSEQIDSGKSEQSILDYFVDKYGPRVLSAPPASGFNLSAWITPFAALAFGVFMVLYFARRFRARWAGPSADFGPERTKYQQQVEEELEKFTPED